MTLVHGSLAARWGMALVFGLTAASAFPQARPTATAPAEDVRFRKITWDGNQAKARTPSYAVTPAAARGQAQEWYRATVEYETAPEWMDELEFRYFLLLRDLKNKRLIYLRGEVSYINVPRGRHNSEIFLHPSTVARYGVPDFFGVEIHMGGQLVAWTARPDEKTRWWTAVPPNALSLAGLVLNHTETPFALVNSDAYNAVKRSGR